MGYRGFNAHYLGHNTLYWRYTVTCTVQEGCHTPLGVHVHSTEDGTDFIRGTLHSTGGNMNSVGGDAAHTEEGALSEKMSTDVRTYIRTVNVMCSMRSFSTPGP